MDREEVIRMAMGVGFSGALDGKPIIIMYADKLERFASLVAAAERERIANILLGTDLSGVSSDRQLQIFLATMLNEYAAAIRALP